MIGVRVLIDAYVPCGKTCFGVMHLQLSSNNYHHQVFIEDTDTFGVVYNANYPLYIERAIGLHYTISPSSPRIVKFKNLKYKAPSRLGDNLKLEVTPNKKNPLLLNAKIIKCRSDDIEISSCIGIEYQETLGRIDATREKFREEKNSPVYTSKFDVYWDEKSHINTLTTETIFKLFERARTNVLGGPDALLALSSGSTHVYVARVSDYEVVRDMNTDHCQVIVKSVCEPLGSLEGGVSMVNFNQYVCDVNDMTILSKAVVTCSCVDAMSRSASAFPLNIAKTFFNLEQVV